MLRLVLVALTLASCSTTSGGTCANPVQSACESQAQAYAATLAKIAAKKNEPVSQMSAEFVNACEGALQNDLDQTLTDLEIIADGGSQ